MVADLTGYPQEMVEPDMDMEADLGIDSIKRVEILAAVQERMPGLKSVESSHMGSLRTLNDIVAYMGGQVGSVCQADLGATMQIIIEDIVASSSPVVMQYVPISVSIACSKDGVALNRSRVEGFDYRASANTVVFVGQEFDPLHPSEVLLSYERWVTDIVPE